MNPVVSQIYNVFRQAGLSSAQACGILGNLKVESDFNPHAVGDHGTAHGLCQWHPDRRSAIRHGCGIDVGSASAPDQAHALIWELQHNETEAWNAVRRCYTARQAAAAFCQLYERPANVEHEMRVRGAIAEQLEAEIA